MRLAESQDASRSHPLRLHPVSLPRRRYVGPSIELIDAAVEWAARHGLQVLLDLHGASSAPSLDTSEERLTPTCRNGSSSTLAQPSQKPSATPRGISPT